MKSTSIFLIAATLIAGMVGCGNGNGPVDNPPVIEGCVIAGSPLDYTVSPEEEFDIEVPVQDDYGIKGVKIQIPDAGIEKNLEESNGSWIGTSELPEEKYYYFKITATDTSDQTDIWEDHISCQEPGPCDYECQQTSPGGRLQHLFENSPFSKYEVVFNWTDTPELYDVGIYPALLQFYFEAGQGGYVGPQIEVHDSGERIVKKLILSIWSMNNEEYTAHPYPEDCHCTYGTSEGKFVQCLIHDDPYTERGIYLEEMWWEEGKEYKITVEKDEELADGVVWKATILDLDTLVENEIGRIKLDDQPGYEGYGLLGGFSWGFFEYYYGNERCLDAEYGKIIRIGPVADDVWLPAKATYWHNECITAITYSPEDGVIIEEVGEGVVRDPEEPIEEYIPLWDYEDDIPLSTLPQEIQELFE
jgi:hypothetical protein